MNIRPAFSAATVTGTSGQGHSDGADEKFTQLWTALNEDPTFQRYVEEARDSISITADNQYKPTGIGSLFGAKDGYEIRVRDSKNQNSPLGVKWSIAEMEALTPDMITAKVADVVQQLKNLIGMSHYKK
ncbi:MAG: hypothetical protein QE263_06720 [Vampirovibrionales bacterium]|nr:hypothetical protein [Vampirovibrionales bacterium]